MFLFVGLLTNGLSYDNAVVFWQNVYLSNGLGSESKGSLRFDPPEYAALRSSGQRALRRMAIHSLPDLHRR